MNISYLFRKFREVGIGLLLISIFQVWFFYRCSGDPITGINLISDPLGAFYASIVVIAYVMSYLRHNFLTWISAILFSFNAIVFNSFILYILAISSKIHDDYCRSAEISDKIGIGMTYQLIGMVFLAIGIYANMNRQYRRNSLVGTVVASMLMLISAFMSVRFPRYHNEPIHTWIISMAIAIPAAKFLES